MDFDQNRKQMKQHFLNRIEAHRQRLTELDVEFLDIKNTPGCWGRLRDHLRERRDTLRTLDRLTAAWGDRDV